MSNVQTKPDLSTFAYALKSFMSSEYCFCATYLFFLWAFSACYYPTKMPVYLWTFFLISLMVSSASPIPLFSYTSSIANTSSCSLSAVSRSSLLYLCLVDSLRSHLTGLSPLWWPLRLLSPTWIGSFSSSSFASSQTNSPRLSTVKVVDWSLYLTRSVPFDEPSWDINPKLFCMAFK